MTVDVAIIGGGIAGLSAAYYAQGAGRSYALLEKSNRWGGKVGTHIIETPAGPVRCELAADGFITRKPWALELVNELGLSDSVIEVNDTDERIYVLVQGKLRPLPDGLHLLVPVKTLPFLMSSLLSPWGKLRVLAERFIPPKSDDTDESLADFVRRRLGDEALDRLAEPMLGGVYNAESDRQSILATFPNFRKLEREYGSLIRGMKAIRANQPPKRDQSGLVSLRGGMGELTGALVDALSGDVRLGVGVDAIDCDADGYTLTLSDGGTLHSRALVMAADAPATANLLRDIAPDASDLLRGIRYEGVGSACLIYRAADIKHPMNAYGVVIPSSENRLIDGLQWATSKWADRAPADYRVIRVFFGGPHTRRTLSLPNDALFAVLRDELHTIMNIDAEPVARHITRYPAAYPQYDVGHLERVAGIQAALPDTIRVAGSAYHGVGLPDCIRSARDAVRGIEDFCAD